MVMSAFLHECLTDVTPNWLSHSSAFLAFSGGYSTWVEFALRAIPGCCLQKYTSDVGGCPDCLTSEVGGCPQIFLLSALGSATKRFEVSGDGESILPGQVAGVVVYHLSHGSAREITIRKHADV